MMDLAPVYDAHPDGNRLLDFVSRQIPAMAAAQQAVESRMVYFVAYNPFRPDHLDVVRRAVLEQGAYGVKVYPPSGYRPIHNERQKAPPRPVAIGQYRRRYVPCAGGAKPSLLDYRMRELLRWCEENDVPVFAHCGTGEFEAQPGYGRSMAHPKYWREYLENHGCKPGTCKLRLCLGHAGGGVYWFGAKGKPGDREWGNIVVELCRTYPNVYAEFGASSEISDRNGQALFVEQLPSIAKSDAAFIAQNHPRYRFRASEKLMYGSDWSMPGAAELGHTYLELFRQALLHPDLGPKTFVNFFCATAARYLDLERGSTNPRLSEAVRERLSKVLDDVRAAEQAARRG